MFSRWPRLNTCPSASRPAAERRSASTTSLTKLKSRRCFPSPNIQIGHRIRHRVEMTCLAGEIKKKLAFLDQRRHRGGVAHIGKIDSHSIADVVNIKQVAAVFWNQAVDQGHFCPELNQASGEGGTDKTEPSRDQDVGAGKNVRIPGHRRIVGRGAKDFL